MARRKRSDEETTDTGDGTAEPGHNGGGGVILTEEQQEALFHHHLNKVRPAIEAVASAVSALRGLYKVAKADGFLKKDIEFALRLENVAEGEITAERARQDQIARFMQHPVGTQPDMFANGGGGGAMEPVSLTAARMAGRLLGFRGQPLVLPDGYVGEIANAFSEGYHAGQAALFDVGSMKNPPAKPTPLERQIQEQAGAQEAA